MFNFPTDLIDIVIVCLLVYAVLNVKHSRAATQIIKAVFALLALTYISNVLSLNTLNFVAGKVFEVGVIALVVVFQPELRRMLERLDSGTITGLLTPRQQRSETEKTIEEVVSACWNMSRQKIGVLIVFERQIRLDEHVKAGTVVDAMVSEELLKNIFFPKAALHDGAVLIRNDRIARAACVLPLSEDPNLNRDLGTRHRAAIGMTEGTDAVVVVVSEETGVISCMLPGAQKRYLTREGLSRLLLSELTVEAPETRKEQLRNRLYQKLSALTGRKEEERQDEE